MKGPDRPAIETGSRRAGQGLGEEGTGVYSNGFGAYFWSDDNILELNSGGVCTTLNILKVIELYTCKRVNCMVHQSYLNIDIILKCHMV